MVKIEGTRETTRDGMEGTVFTIRVLSLTETDAKGRARGAMLGRFPSNVGKVEVLGVEDAESDFPLINAFRVEVFVPHNNPSNESRYY